MHSRSVFEHAFPGTPMVCLKSESFPRLLKLLAALVFVQGILPAQEGGGQAEIGFQQYYLSVGSQRVADISGLALSYSQFVPGVGLLSASFAPALSSNRFRTGDDYLRLNGLPWKGQHWQFSVGDFRVPGQLLRFPFTNLYVPEIVGRGFSAEASHDGRTIGFFYGTETISNTPLVVLRQSVPQTFEGVYLRQQIGARLQLGARLMRFSNDLAALQSLSGLLALDNHLKTATVMTLAGSYTLAGPLKWYGEAAWSAAEQETSVPRTGHGSFSAMAGPILETRLFSLRANYTLQSASYFPVLGYYVGDRQGPFGEIAFHPFAALQIYGTASQYRNNVANNPGVPEFRNSTESTGASLQLPGRLSLNGQLTFLDLSSRLNASQPWNNSRNQQQSATLARSFARHNLRVSAREFRQVSQLGSQQQRSAEIDDTFHYKHLLLGGGVRAQRVIADESRTTFFYRGLAQLHFGSFGVYGNIEKGTDLQNRTLLATNAISTTVIGASKTIGKHWEFQAEAYRNNLVAELNPESIFVLQGQGVFIPGTLAALNQWSVYARVSRRFQWGKAGAATDIVQYAIAKAPLKGSIDGIVMERIAAGNRPAEGVAVSLDQSHTVMTDRDGKFHFAEVPEGLHRVALSSEELLADFDPGPNRERSVPVYPGKLSRADLDVIRLLMIQGKVIGPPNVSLDAIAIRLAPGNRYTTPDIEGNFFFYNLREGEYTVSLDEKTLPEYAVLEKPGPVARTVKAGGQPEPVAFTFEVRKPAKPVRQIFQNHDAPAARMTRQLPAEIQRVPAAPVVPPPPVKPPVVVRPPQLPRPQVPAAEAAAAQAYNLAGRKLAQAGHYREAIAQLDEAIRINPGFALAYNARGYSRLRLREYRAALDDLDEAIRLDPKYANAYQIRETVRKAMGASVAAADDSSRRTNQLAGETRKPAAPVLVTPPVVAQTQQRPQPPLTPGPDSAQKHNLAGRQLTQEGRYREAIAEFDEAIRINPEFAPAYNARGYARFRLHDYAAAIEDLTQAIRLNGAYANAYQIRALARKAIGDQIGAAADTKRAKGLAL